jgi:hypothetical protein
MATGGDRLLERYQLNMNSHFWCHGTKCHTSHTLDRVRGSKGSKVLRTRKIKENNWNHDRWTKYFCSQSCMYNFIEKHMQRIVALDPRTSALETPINEPKKDSEGYYNSWVITKRGVDTAE